MPEAKKKSHVWRWVIIIFCSLLLAFIIRLFFFESFRMPSAQMETTILSGDRICVNKTAYGFKIPVIKENKVHWVYYCSKPVGRNDIVLYKSGDNIMISRCVGLPGDSLEVKAFEYYVNGRKIIQSPNVILPYQYPLAQDMVVQPTMKKCNFPLRESFDENGEKVRFFSKYEYYTLTDILPDSIVFTNYEKGHKNYSIRIPEEQYWMLSDNVEASADSRHLGFVPHTALIGRASFVWFSKDPIRDLLHGYRWDRIFTKASR